MPTNYTEQDAANTAVRAFLSSIGGSYLDTGKWNTGSGQGEKYWQKIKEYFSNQCAYCGADDKPLMREHLVMLNRGQCGLHHPGNVVSCCRKCNTRRRNDGKYPSWSGQLQIICKHRKVGNGISERRKVTKGS